MEPYFHPEKPSRAEFINKVLNYVCGQLAITTIITMYMYFNRDKVIEQQRKIAVLFGFLLLCRLLILSLCFMIKKIENVGFGVLL